MSVESPSCEGLGLWFYEFKARSSGCVGLRFKVWRVWGSRWGVQTIGFKHLGSIIVFRDLGFRLGTARTQYRNSLKIEGHVKGFCIFIF